MQTETENFDEIVSAYYQPLYRFGYSLAKNEHEASDLAQQTFFIYAEKGTSVRDKSKVKSGFSPPSIGSSFDCKRKDDRMDNYEPEMLESSRRFRRTSSSPLDGCQPRCRGTRRSRRSLSPTTQPLLSQRSFLQGNRRSARCADRHHHVALLARQSTTARIFKRKESETANAL